MARHLSGHPLRSYSIAVRHTPSVRLLWTSDNTQHFQETDSQAPDGIRNGNPSKRSASDPRFRPRGLLDRPSVSMSVEISLGRFRAAGA
jgi:hypothetical protein